MSRGTERVYLLISKETRQNPKLKGTLFDREQMVTLTDPLGRFKQGTDAFILELIEMVQ